MKIFFNFITLILIFILSILITIGLPVITFGYNSFISDGFPQKWTQLNFLGSTTNYQALFIDIIFWFIAIWITWQIFKEKILHHGKKK